MLVYVTIKRHFVTGSLVSAYLELDPGTIRTCCIKHWFRKNEVQNYWMEGILNFCPFQWRGLSMKQWSSPSSWGGSQGQILGAECWVGRENPILVSLERRTFILDQSTISLIRLNTKNRTKAAFKDTFVLPKSWRHISFPCVMSIDIGQLW